MFSGLRTFPLTHLPPENRIRLHFVASAHRQIAGVLVALELS
ncbi:hypothetical protein [Pantoea sp. C2G6]